MTAPAPASPSSTLVTELTERAGAWFNVSLVPHSPRAVSFQLDEASMGILHHDGLLEIPVPAPIRTVLVEEGFAVAHSDRPGTDWVAVHLDEADDMNSAVLLLRLSYLYRRLLRSQNPATLRRIRIEVRQYALPEPLETIYEKMLAKRDLDTPGMTLPGAPLSPK